MNEKENTENRFRMDSSTSARQARRAQRRRGPAQEQDPVASPEMESAVGITVDELSDLFTLMEVKQFGPQKFKAAYEHGLKPGDLVRDPSRLPITGKRGDEIRRGIAALAVKSGSIFRSGAKRQIAAAHKVGAKIVTYWQDAYPPDVFQSNYPVPALYVRGSTAVLRERRIIACVGSRLIRPPYSDLHRAFAELAARLDFAVVSGFALGADTIGHETAWRAGKKTICVLPGGLDRAFPPENKALWNSLLDYEGAALVSEARFGIRASSLLLRRRNKLIVAFAQGVLVSQTASGGGAMNAYRFAAEQRKPIATFTGDGAKDTTGNQVIAEDDKNQVSVLPSDPSSHEIWRQWLLKLSSST